MPASASETSGLPEQAGGPEQPSPAPAGEAGAAQTPRAPAWRCPRCHVLLWGTAVLGLASDLISKHLAFEHLRSGQKVEVIPGVLSFYRSLNFGALFGIGHGLTMLFVMASVLAVAFVAYMFATSHRRQWVAHLALGLVLAGAMGNLYDRLFVKIDIVERGRSRQVGVVLPQESNDQWVAIGEYPGGREPIVRLRRNADLEVERLSAVRDFIQIELVWRKLNLWPWIFNIADAMLVVGVSLLLIIYWRHPLEGEQEQAPAGEG